MIINYCLPQLEIQLALVLGPLLGQGGQMNSSNRSKVISAPAKVTSQSSIAPSFSAGSTILSNTSRMVGTHILYKMNGDV